MKKLLLFVLFIIPAAAFAQKRTGAIKGLIYDSVNDFALQAASVTVYKLPDSSIVDFQLSNASGEFDIKGLPLRAKLFLAVTHTGYKSSITNFALDSIKPVIDLRKLLMVQRNEGELEEVVVKTVQPLRMNGDTLEINPNAFKLDSNAVVEDMLLRVPGLTVWGDGTITMNGRKLEKVYVDGKPFFGGAAQTATQNLPKNAIEKIQLYQEKDLSKISNSDQKNDSLYSMNIKLKEDKKKGLFGKIGAGYGTDSRYQGDGVLQGYDKKNQFGIAAGINNINKEEGTGENAFEQNTFKSNFRIFYMGRGNEGGITRRTYGNLKWQHNFSESDNSQFFNRFTTDYGYLNTLQNVNTNTTSVSSINNYKQTSVSQNANQSINESHTAKFQYENRKKWGNFVSLNGAYTHSDNSTKSNGINNVYTNDTEQASRNISENYGRNTNDNINISGFIRSNDVELKNDPRKNFMVGFWAGYNQSKANNGVLSKFESFGDSAYTNIIDRKYNNDNKNYNANVYLNYDGLRPLLFGIYNFFNIGMSLRNDFTINRSETDARVADLDSITDQYISNAALTNKNTLTNITYKPGLSFTKSFSKYILGQYNYWAYFGLDMRYQFMDLRNTSSLLYRNIQRNYSTFTPGVNANFNYQKENAFRMGANAWFGRNIAAPSIDQLVPIVDNSSRYSIIVGNQHLEAGTSNYGNFQFDINRNKMGAKTTYGLTLGVNLNTVQNAIGDSIVYTGRSLTGDSLGTGLNYRYLINVKQQNNLSGNWSMSFSRNIDKKNTISLAYKGNVSKKTQPGYINSLFSISRNNTWSNNFTIQYNLIDKFNISLGETIGTNNNMQTNSTVPASMIKNYTTTSNINYFITKAITLNTSVNYQENIAANNNTVKATVWNASTVYRFMQQKGELKFSAFDLLRQNRNINNFLARNSATTTVTNGLQQYFMLTFSYYPRRFGSKNSHPPPPGGQEGYIIATALLILQNRRLTPS